MSAISTPDFVWALGSVCALHQRPFDAQLLLRQVVPPYGEASLVEAARALGFKAQAKALALTKLAGQRLPLLVHLHVGDSIPAPDSAANDSVANQAQLGLVVRAEQAPSHRAAAASHSSRPSIGIW